MTTTPTVHGRARLRHRTGTLARFKRALFHLSLAGMLLSTVELTKKRSDRTKKPPVPESGGRLRLVVS